MHIDLKFELKYKVTGITSLPKLSKIVVGARAMKLVRGGNLCLCVELGSCRVEA
jgi:hypothetical protein